MNKAIFQLILLQLRSFYREPGILFWALAFPILIAWVLGIAFSQKAEVQRTVMFADESRSDTVAFERLLGEEIGSPSRFRFIPADSTRAMQAMKRGEINLFFQKKSDKVLFYFDPQNPDAQHSYLMLERDFNKNETFVSRAEVVPLTTKGTRYIDFLIPGLIAMGIMNSCIWGISWNLIEFRMKKLLRRMVATPMSKPEFLYSHIITRFFITAFEGIILVFFAWIYFDMEISGSVTALLLIFIAGLTAFFGLSVLISSRIQNSQIGNGVINAVVLPMTILSGVFFSYHNFPDWTIPFIQILPLTMLADTMRSIFIEGAGLADAIVPSLVLVAEGTVFFAIGLRIYKWY